MCAQMLEVSIFAVGTVFSVLKGMRGQWLNEVRLRPPWWVFARTLGMASVGNDTVNYVSHCVS